MTVAQAQVPAMACYQPGETTRETGNRAVTDSIEPGSVNKVVTFAAALEKGLIKPDTVLNVDGSIDVGGITVHDAWAHGPVNMMGDTGSLALGGLIAGLSILTRTELLLVVIAGLFVVEMLSVVIQIAVFKTRHVRVFKMAPFHHHFELAGWAETTVMVRFWLLAAMSAALGLGLFYAEWLALTGG